MLARPSSLRSASSARPICAASARPIRIARRSASSLPRHARSSPVSCQAGTASTGNMSDIVRLDCGPRLSEATIHNGTVYLAGQVPEDVTKDIKGQTAEVLACIDDLLTRAGTDKTRILMAQVFVTDLSEFSGFNEVWDKWVAPGFAPARATVQVPKLADPGWKLEVVITAALP